MIFYCCHSKAGHAEILFGSTRSAAAVGGHQILIDRRSFSPVLISIRS
jgi:hypothetical protein